MRRKALLTVALCAVLATASVEIDDRSGHLTYTVTRTMGAETDTSLTVVESIRETQAPETTPPETQPPATEPPQTQPSETAPPETQPPATEPPQTQPAETQPPSETTPPETQLPSETAPPETQLPSETMPPETQPSSESETPQTSVQQSETPGDTILPDQEETEKKKKKKKKETETETEFEIQSETSKYKSNEELLAHQNIVIPPEIRKEFRFTKVDTVYAIVRERDGAAVYESRSADARKVGELDYYGICCILEDQKDGWYYVESGNVRGFVQADALVSGETADRIVKIRGLEELPTARLLVARSENEAFTHTQTTAQEVMAPKDYALASGTVTICEQRKSSSRATGELADHGLCYILADSDKDWVYVESGDARGFVEKEKLITGSTAADYVSEHGEKNLSLADVLVEPEDNDACYYTITSVEKADQASRTRQAMVQFAKQFLGNPYVWGGTSLTNGADCSGFVQSIYAYFGYSLPRVAEDQSGYGIQIPISYAEPGDLIFYARNGYVYHVSMYIGNGQVIEAAGRRVGIIISGIDSNAVWATRVITN